MKLTFRHKEYELQAPDMLGWVDLGCDMDEFNEKVLQKRLTKHAAKKAIRALGKTHLVGRGVPWSEVRRASPRQIADALIALGNAAKKMTRAD